MLREGLTPQQCKNPENLNNLSEAVQRRNHNLVLAWPSCFTQLRPVFCCPGVRQASALQDFMGYFLSDAVQQNLPGYTFQPVPRALLVAGRQAVASMTTNQTQTRGGQAAVPTASGGNSGTQLLGTLHFSE